MIMIISSSGDPLCWICGDPATTGEHKAKRSDLKAVFGEVSQQDPLIFNGGRQKNRRVGSLDSPFMKWIDVLCADCNNRRTRSHDRAWEEFSRELLSDVALLVPGATILLSNILGVDHGRIMLGVHHYLAKAFGCLAAQELRFAAKIDLLGLGQSIREGRAYPALFFDVGVPPRVSNGPIVSASDPQLYLNPYDGSCGLATWFYNVNGVCALVAYAPRNGWLGTGARTVASVIQDGPDGRKELYG
jgi:hypothetical protein